MTETPPSQPRVAILPWVVGAGVVIALIALGAVHLRPARAHPKPLSPTAAMRKAQTVHVLQWGADATGRHVKQETWGARSGFFRQDRYEDGVLISADLETRSQRVRYSRRSDGRDWVSETTYLLPHQAQPVARLAWAVAAGDWLTRSATLKTLCDRQPVTLRQPGLWRGAGEVTSVEGTLQREVNYGLGAGLRVPKGAYIRLRVRTEATGGEVRGWQLERRVEGVWETLEQAERTIEYDRPIPADVMKIKPTPTADVSRATAP